jgi:hypothetical protein
VPLLTGFSLNINANDVLQAQGADPGLLHLRSPDLIEAAEVAIEHGLPLLNPMIWYERRSVIRVQHTRIKLEGGNELRGSLVMEHIAGAKEVIIAVCTVGKAIDERVRSVFQTDPVHGLALDGVGSAAVNVLSATAAHYFEEEARENKTGISVPLSPGMQGWSVEEGQPQLFKLLENNQIGVRLSENYVMHPAKSLTLLMGIGPDVESRGSICEYCSVKESCRYRSISSHIVIHPE